MSPPYVYHPNSIAGSVYNMKLNHAEVFCEGQMEFTNYGWLKRWLSIKWYMIFSSHRSKSKEQIILCYYIATETADDVEIRFRLWKLMCCNRNVSYICSLGCNWQSNVDSDDGLMQNRRQASLWTNGGLHYWHQIVIRPQSLIQI